MASLYDTPGMVASRDSARRDFGLLHRAYRQARRDDPVRALKIAQQADAMGIPIGRPAHDEEIAGTGEANYFRGLRRAGVAAPATGVDAYDHNQNGVGYDFRQTADRPAAASPMDDYRAAYKSAGDDEMAQNQIIAKAHAEGIPLSSYGRQRLLTASILKPKGPVQAVGAPIPEGSTVPKPPPQITSPGSPAAPQAGPGANFQSLLKKSQPVASDNSAITEDRARLARTGSAFPPGTDPANGRPLVSAVDNPEVRKMGNAYQGLLTRGYGASPEQNDRVTAAHEATLAAEAQLQSTIDQKARFYKDRGITEEESLDPDRVNKVYQVKMGEARDRRRKLLSLSDKHIGDMEDERAAEENYAGYNTFYNAMTPGYMKRYEEGDPLDDARKVRRRLLSR